MSPRFFILVLTLTCFSFSASARAGVTCHQQTPDQVAVEIDVTSLHTDEGCPLNITVTSDRYEGLKLPLAFAIEGESSWKMPWRFKNPRGSTGFGPLKPSQPWARMPACKYRQVVRGELPRGVIGTPPVDILNVTCLKRKLADEVEKLGRVPQLADTIPHR